MDRRKFSLTMVGAAVLAGCGGGGGGSSGGFAFPAIASAPPPAPAPAPASAPAPAVDPGPVVPAGPEFATATALPAGAAFLQTIDATDGDGYISPGQANIWDLNQDFSIEDGGNDQFDGALHLTVDVGGTQAPFPSDQVYAELSALGPEMGASDGVKSVTFTSDAQFLKTSGGYAFLHAGAEVRLQQTLNLASAVGGVTLAWSGVPSQGNAGSPLADPGQYGQVVVRDTAGALLATLFRVDGSGTTGAWGSGSLTAFAGQTVVLSFEQRVWAQGSAIDNVSVQDANNTEFVINGDFEAQGTGWTVTAAKLAQNVRTGVRTLNGLEVQRTFFTQPNLLWARITDVFHNPSAATIDAVVSYDTDLGSDGGGIIYPTPGATQKALSTWDGTTGDRDIGFAFGTADSVIYTSATTLGIRDGSENVSVRFNISVPAGGTVTLMNFVVLTGTDTGLTATDITARATQADTQAADIANNFRTNFAYQRGLTQAQLDTLKNF
ncbi:UNVERIFIED_ORG: hypothetical protein J2W38_006071 [Variovorax paradoxus]|jgi:hypothetical protein|nr:hypothetical protein [Variovorax paradoxus]